LTLVSQPISKEYVMQGLVSLIGRALLAVIFLYYAIASYILDYANTTQLMRQHGIPAANWLHMGAIAVLLVGSISLILGAKARWGAALLAVFLALSAYYFHDFWNIQDAAQAQVALAHLLKNLSMIGALIFIIANGAGEGSMDACCARRRCSEKEDQ
jgi:putative oxidoreductase